MSNILRRIGEETWREAAIRQGRKFGCEAEILKALDRQTEDSEATTAYQACLECDALDHWPLQ